MIDSYDVVVVGSCMIDLFCYAERLPKPGETIHGTKFQKGEGGKGANQCVAAAKLGANTALIARLGIDFGEEYKNALKNLGVDTRYVTLTEGISSGMAQITVSEKGDNQIVIVSGANSRLSIDDVKNAKDAIQRAKVILFQFETPIETTIKALEYIKDNFSGSTLIVNGAPANSNVDHKIYRLCDIFCVNENEAEEMGNVNVKSVNDSKLAVKKFISLGCKEVIITMGNEGAVYGSKDVEAKHIPCEETRAIDTTGAGDAFLGALAFFTARLGQLPMEERIKRSCQVASYSVQRSGTQSSYPVRRDLADDLFQL